MTYLKNLLVGFVVSMVGSMPLGYINVIALKIYQAQGMSSLTLFLLGVVIIEFLLILLTLRAANWLHGHAKFTKATEILSIVFMLALAISFYNGTDSGGQKTIPDFLAGYPPFVLGLALNCINLVQVPFWMGWNLYLINAGYIEVSHKRKYAYVTGTSAGTFTGVFIFVMILQKVLSKTSQISPWLSVHIFSLIFVLLAIMQSVKFYRKHLQAQG
jgi:hypothetical protein